MVRVKNLEMALDFYCDKLGLVETRRYEDETGRFTLVFLATLEDVRASNNPESFKFSPTIEITWNWDKQTYSEGKNFGHLAY